MNLLHELSKADKGYLPAIEQQALHNFLTPPDSQVNEAHAYQWLQHVVKTYHIPPFKRILENYEAFLAAQVNDGFNTVDETDTEMKMNAGGLLNTESTATYLKRKYDVPFISIEGAHADSKIYGEDAVKQAIANKEIANQYSKQALSIYWQHQGKKYRELLDKNPFELDEYNGKSYPRIFVRLGLPPEDKTGSTGYYKGQHVSHNGVSVFPAVYDAASRFITVLTPSESNTLDLWEGIAQKRKMYLVEGEEMNEEGTGGEPLLSPESLKVIGEVDMDYVLPDYGSFDGETLSGKLIEHNPFDNTELASGGILHDAVSVNKIHRLLRTEKAFEILDSDPELSGSDWGAGGCYVLARALKRIFGGQLVTIYNAQNRPQHIMLQLGHLYLDYDGLQPAEQKLKSAKEEFVNSPYIGDFNPQNLGEIGIGSQQTEDALVEYLSGAYNERVLNAKTFAKGGTIKPSTITVKVPVSSQLVWNAGIRSLQDMSQLTDAEFINVWKYVLAGNYMLRSNVEVSDYVHGKNHHVLQQCCAPDAVDRVNSEFKRRSLEGKYSLFIEKKNKTEKTPSVGATAQNIKPTTTFPSRNEFKAAIKLWREDFNAKTFDNPIANSVLVFNKGKGGGKPFYEVLKHGSPISENLKAYRFEDAVSKWFYYEKTEKESKDKTLKLLTEFSINLREPEAITFYHGTNLEGKQSILKSGLSLDYGNIYTSTNLHTAKGFGCDKYSEDLREKYYSQIFIITPKLSARILNLGNPYVAEQLGFLVKEAHGEYLNFGLMQADIEKYAIDNNYDAFMYPDSLSGSGTQVDYSTTERWMEILNPKAFNVRFFGKFTCYNFMEAQKQGEIYEHNYARQVESEKRAANYKPLPDFKERTAGEDEYEKLLEELKKTDYNHRTFWPKYGHKTGQQAYYRLVQQPILKNLEAYYEKSPLVKSGIKKQTPLPSQPEFKPTQYNDSNLPLGRNVFINYKYPKPIIEALLKQLQPGEMYKAGKSYGPGVARERGIRKTDYGSYEIWKEGADVFDAYGLKGITDTVKLDNIQFYAPVAPVIITTAKKEYESIAGYKAFKGLHSGPRQHYYMVKFSDGKSFTTNNAETATKAKQLAWEWYSKEVNNRHKVFAEKLYKFLQLLHK